MIQAIIFSIIYGWIEQRLLKDTDTGDYVLFGHFSYYHLVMLAMFFVVAWDSPHYVFLMALIQDIFYHIFKGNKLDPDSWVNWFFGGFYFFKHWIPTSYILLLLMFLLFEYWPLLKSLI